MKFQLVILLSLLFFVPTQAQELYSVIADNGLNVREKPSLNSEHIGKFYCGEDIKLIEKTNVNLSVNEHGKTINGFWYIVTSTSREDSVLRGYVFSGYLLKRNDHRNMGLICPRGEIDCITDFSTNNNQFKIFNFQIEGQSTKKDTLILYEDVFNEIGDKLLKIEPKKAYKKIEVYYTRIESLNEYGRKENSFGEIPKWKGHKPYIKLESSNEFYYRIPLTDYDHIRESRAKALSLERAANWDDVGEGWWVPKYKYKGVIAPYEIRSVLLKIITTDLKNQRQIEFIEIILSYGC